MLGECHAQAKKCNFGLLKSMHWPQGLPLSPVCAGFMFTGAALVSGAGDGETGMLEGLIIEKLNGWDIEKRY